MRVVKHDDVAGIPLAARGRLLGEELLQRQRPGAPRFQRGASGGGGGDHGHDAALRLVGAGDLGGQPRLSAPRTAGDERQPAALGAGPHRAGQRLPL